MWHLGLRDDGRGGTNLRDVINGRPLSKKSKTKMDEEEVEWNEQYVV